MGSCVILKGGTQHRSWGVALPHHGHSYHAVAMHTAERLHETSDRSGAGDGVEGQGGSFDDRATRHTQG